MFNTEIFTFKKGKSPEVGRKRYLPVWGVCWYLFLSLLGVDDVQSCLKEAGRKIEIK